MNKVKLGIMIPVKIASSELSLNLSILRLSQIHPVVFRPCDRHFSTCNVLETKRGAGKEQGKMERSEIVKMVENEKRGIFRTLDIGLPRPFRERKKRDDRIIVKAAPRYVIHLSCNIMEDLLVS